MIIKCPACEHDVSDKAIRCNKCGEPIKSNTAVATPNGKTNATLSYIIMAIVLIIGIVVFVNELLHYGALKDEVNQILELQEAQMRFMQSMMEGMGF